MATNYDSVDPIGAVSRWSSSKKEKVKVAQPSVFGTYNNGMGGMDLSIRPPTTTGWAFALRSGGYVHPDAKHFRGGFTKCRMKTDWTF
ncbi:hypothetical protein HPB48_021252 [Haemaphysalis longicornis]|uniref:Uncharacterized protein n=1 Tax=Haemaphysalis longicornis TaxID=44386 RepID=A0A9J6H419_HAELO|nr:hypothetical protein HPB48_021252 [Haemaphysalis longicornis]